MRITYFDVPHKFLSDNGGEFSNESYRQMNKNLNLLTLTIAVESPFNNGMIERHNSILSENFIKTLQDPKCKPEVNLTWTMSPKTSLQNFGGFSPNQLVFGYNPNFSSVLVDK